MFAKMSAARRKTILEALAETGNQTLSAERAKVSRSWVSLHRSTDAGFDAACREAIERARDKFKSHPHPAAPSPQPSPARGEGAQARGSRRPPAAWQFNAGEELVVSGTNGVRTQVRRAKLRQWTPRVEGRFLSALSASCNVKAALAAVGMSASGAYAHRKRFPAFARAWDEAIAIGLSRLEGALIQNIDFAFDPEAAPPELDMGEITVSDAIRTLRMYQKMRR